MSVLCALSEDGEMFNFTCEGVHCNYKGVSSLAMPAD